MAENYNAEERERLRSAFRGGPDISGEAAGPVCPACGGVIAVRSVPAKPELPYVRRRVWLICSGCKRSLTLESGG
jgi:hypothetical protein